MGSGHVDSLDSQHVSPAVRMVLEARCADYLGAAAPASSPVALGTSGAGGAGGTGSGIDLLTPEQQEVVWCLAQPAMFYADLSNAAVVHVNTASLYTAMGL